MTAKPATAPPAAAKPAPANNDLALELGGGALAILALGGGAYALARRRRRADEEAWQTDYVEPTASAEPELPLAPRHDPITEREAPTVAPEPEPSAFAWGNAPQRAESARGDRRQGETWVERAYRGPSEDNPSLSLRKRLKRAAFFDKRDRDAAAGRAVPVEADAGLPEQATVDERELEVA